MLGARVQRPRPSHVAAIAAAQPLSSPGRRARLAASSFLHTTSYYAFFTSRGASRRDESCFGLVVIVAGVVRSPISPASVAVGIRTSHPLFAVAGRRFASPWSQTPRRSVPPYGNGDSERNTPNHSFSDSVQRAEVVHPVSLRGRHALSYIQTRLHTCETCHLGDLNAGKSRVGNVAST